MQWRLQVNRLQELIDQLECKVSGHVASAPRGRTFLESAYARHTPGALHTLCVPHRPPGWNLCMKRSLPRGLSR